MTAETILIDWILPTIYLALTVAGVIALRRSMWDPKDDAYERTRARSRASEEKLTQELAKLDEVKRR
jgi:hypothetical protein